VIIRPIDASETNAVSELLVTAYVSGGHLSADSLYILELSDVTSRLNYTWVAEVGGNIVGTISLCPPDGTSPAMICRENEYEFRFLAVLPDSWGSGVGQALVAECETQARAHGSEKIVISVIDLNERALQFYALQGYTRLPERNWSPERTQVQILALTKNL